MSTTIQKWRPHLDGDTGETFDLSHLDATRVQIVQPATADKPEKFTTGFVTFSHHCFTRSPRDDEAFTTNQIYFEPLRESRLFCHDRYALSKTVLMNLLHNKLTDGTTKCFNTDRGTLLIIETIDYQNNPVSYEVYFNVVKSIADDIDIHIRLSSAFIRDSRQGRRVSHFQRISLSVIAHKTIRGEPLPTRRR